MDSFRRGEHPAAKKEPFLHLQPLGMSVPGCNTLFAELSQIGIDSTEIAACYTNLLVVTAVTELRALQSLQSCGVLGARNCLALAAVERACCSLGSGQHGSLKAN